MIFRIAIVEDEVEQVDRLKQYIERFCKENSISYEISLFKDGEEILTNYKAKWDLILMDIEMPHVDGMKAAQKIRQIDQHTVLIFVTAMARYAIRGYEVDALDFVLKPVGYAAFSMKLRKVVNMIKSREQRMILISTGSSLVKLAVDDILYVEVANHKLSVHTAEQVFHQSGNLKDMEAQLSGTTFAKCNNGYLVNLRNVNSIEKDECIMSNGDHLPISRAKKKEFYQLFAEYIGGSFR